MSPPVQLIEIRSKNDEKKQPIKRISLTNLSSKFDTLVDNLNLSDSRLSLDESSLIRRDLKSVCNRYNSSAKTLNENFNADDNLEDDMIGLGSLSSTGSNTDSLKHELDDLDLKNDDSINRSTSRADTGLGSDISSSPLPHSTKSSIDERNNSISTTSDDVSDLELINDDLQTNKFKIINDLTVIYPMSLNSDIEDDETANRRDTIVFANNKPKDDQSDLEMNLKQINADNCRHLSLPINSTLSSTNSACEVASLSSVYSNYSQFDFLHQNRTAPSPPPILENIKQEDIKFRKQEVTTGNSGLSSFLGLFGNKKQEKVEHQQQQHPTTPNKFDLITSKFFNFNKIAASSTKPELSKPILEKQATTSAISYSSSSSSSTSLAEHQLDSLSVKTNHSTNNLNCNSDLQVPNSVLIFENRPSNLPAKSQQEALKHRQEYEKMVEIAKKKELKEKEIKHKKNQQQMKKEDFMANSLKIWNNEIIADWNEQKSSKRTQQLWWHGLPPSIRGKVWKLAIGNDLDLTNAKQKLELLSKNCPKSGDKERTHESSVELIKLDVSRTFPQLSFFQKDGPYHEALHNVLGAYACYNSHIGYVQGMSFLTAILLLNMEAIDAFICLANLLNTKILLACFCMDQAKMNRYFRVHQILLEYNIPKLYRHFEEQNVKPDLYLIDWIFTLFSKSLPLDVMSRVWDVFFRDNEEFLFRTSLGILNLYKETLLEMDFIHIVQFLTKLPENINSTQLFKSIEQVTTCIDDITFDTLTATNT